MVGGCSFGGNMGPADGTTQTTTRTTEFFRYNRYFYFVVVSTYCYALIVVVRHKC